MKILTLNTHSWREDEQIEKLKHLAQTIVQRDYDIIAMQEVNQMVTEPRLEDGILRKNNFMKLLIDEIVTLGGIKYEGYWQPSKTIRDTFEEGSCLLTKEPILEKECFVVSQKDDSVNPKTRKIVRVTIAHNNRLIDLYSCHLGWWQDTIEPFKYQCDALLDNMNPNRFSVLMGDFNNNANLRDEGYDYILNKGLWDTYTLAEEKDEGSTVEGEISGWEGNKVDLRIDLILMSEKRSVKTSRVIFNGEHKQVISDHYGVEAEICL